MKTGKIVVVDDDKIVTSALKTLFKVEGFCDAEYFNNPLEAVEYLRKEKPDLIISDFLMPEMNGLEFLSTAKELYPETSMILLTGYADKENAIRAINEIGLYKYIEKPWDNDDLVITIQNGIERSHLLAELRNKITELEAAKKELENYSQNLEVLVAKKSADLVKSHSQLSAVINNCADGILLLDESGKVERANPACENLFSLSEENLVRMNIAQLTRSEGKKFEDAVKEGTDALLRDYYAVNALSLNEVPVEISLAKITTEDGSKKYVGVIRDITVQKETERLRDDFIATLTHDLRTPLLAAIQTLKFFIDGSLGELDSKQKMLLATMEQSNEDLLGLVNALLEVYKYESGKLTLCKTNFPIKDLAEQSYRELKPLADKKSIHFKLDFCADDNLVIRADRSEIRRVITNLCGNAINYTDCGGEIIITVKEQSGDLIFSVSDNGNGIPKEDIPSLFKRFSQGTSKKRSTGTGLGLYLSRQIIEAHNGKIWLESKISKGSEFSFLLTDVVQKKVEVAK